MCRSVGAFPVDTTKILSPPVVGVCKLVLVFNLYVCTTAAEKREREVDVPYSSSSTKWKHEVLLLFFEALNHDSRTSMARTPVGL